MKNENVAAKIQAVKNTLLKMKEVDWQESFVPADHEDLFDQTALCLFENKEAFKHYGFAYASVLVSHHDLQGFVGSSYSSMDIEECLSSLPVTLSLVA